MCYACGAAQPEKRHDPCNDRRQGLGPGGADGGFPEKLISEDYGSPTAPCPTSRERCLPWNIRGGEGVMVPPRGGVAGLSPCPIPSFKASLGAPLPAALHR